MDRTQQIKDAHPRLSYDEVVKVILYLNQGSMLDTEPSERQAWEVDGSRLQSLLI